MNKSSKMKIIIPVVIAVAVIAAVVAFMAFSGNKKAGEPMPPTVTGPAVTVQPTATPNPHEGKEQSYLTGEWISKEKAKKRPFAIMINNIGYANANQKGTSQADVLYEALAEGGITRMLAVYQDPSKIKKIGSVRSARHYYVSFASEWNAIYCHFGQTSYALTKIDALGVENLSGLSAIGSTVYARDNSYRAPHNVYASGKGMIAGAKKLKYSLKQDMKKVAKHYAFYEEDTDLEDAVASEKENDDITVKKATKVVLPFSTYSTAYFTYNKEKKVYEKYEYKRKHMDTAANKQLKFKNIIIQLVEERNIDRNGYQTMKIHKKRGKGYYCTNGKVIPIEWNKNEEEGRMCYWDLNGKQSKVNVGKTYIGVFPTSEQKNITFTEKKK
ncbi:MAG: DUF3048 domain-containing protein [Lachnospiraceae bacterium]|nr:DUF3048 domain-containing protein [Lachnospiraceae bacterium]